MTGAAAVHGEGTLRPSEITAVSVVIPHYGDPDDALALIAQLRSQTDAPAIEIIVSDDLSPQPFPDTEGVVVVRRTENGGFGAAVNSGARAATHPYLLVLNSDLDVAPDFVGALCREAEPWQPAVCAPLLIGFDGVTQWAGRHFPRHRHHIVEWLTPLARFRPRLHDAVGRDTRCVEGATLSVDWLAGAALLIPRDAFVRVGGFDEGFFMNSEEIDLQRRLREQGIPSMFLGNVTVRHEGGASSDSAKRVRWLTQSRIRYAKKWGEHPELLRFGLAFASFVNLAFNAVRRVFGRDVYPLQSFKKEWSALRKQEIGRGAGA